MKLTYTDLKIISSMDCIAYVNIPGFSNPVELMPHYWDMAKKECAVNVSNTIEENVNSGVNTVSTSSANNVNNVSGTNPLLVVILPIDKIELQMINCSSLPKGHIEFIQERFKDSDVTVIS
jgi:hypothetical protein